MNTIELLLLYRCRFEVEYNDVKSLRRQNNLYTYVVLNNDCTNVHLMFIDDIRIFSNSDEYLHDFVFIIIMGNP